MTDSASYHSVLIDGLGSCGLPSSLSVRVEGGGDSSGGLRGRRIREAISSRCPQLPADAFLLTLDGRLLHDEADEEEGEHVDASVAAAAASSSQRLAAAAVECAAVGSPLLLRVVFRSALLGGKGGFGSLLRTATTKVGAKKTDNFSASRDLSGRRMRHVEAERAIAQWNAQHHEPIDQRDLNAKFKAIKEGRPVDVKACKWGPTCKYRYSTCRLAHGEDPDAAAFARPAPITSMSAVVPLPEVSAKDLAVSSSHMEHAVSKGLQSSKKRLRGGASATDGESKEQSDDGQSDDEQDAYSSSSSSAASDDEDAPAPKRLHTAAASSSSAAAAAAAASSSSAADAVPLSAVYAATYVAPTPYFPSITHRAPDLDAIDGKQAQMGLAAVMAKVKAKQHAHSGNSNGGSNGDSPPAPAAASAAAAAAASSSSHGAIDLSTVVSASDLLRFDAAHLAHELTRVGLKAGGTHEQKAQRLFMLKGTTIDKLPKKVLAAA